MDASTPAGELVIIGGGVMGEIILSGLIRAGWDAARLSVAERTAARGAQLAGDYGVRVFDSNTEAVAAADTVLLIVKPVDALAVLADISSSLKAGSLVVSLCAGLATATLEQPLPPGQAVIRVMPNTPARVGAGMAAISAGSSVSERQLQVAGQIMGAVGRTVVVAEKYQDAVTAVSGSGPAYLFYVAEAMIEAGVLLGLPREVAEELTTETLYGSAQLLRESNHSATVLRQQVTSPGGTTAAALREFHRLGIRAAIVTGMEACRDRSIAMGNAAG